MHLRQNTWLHSTSKPKGGSASSWQTPQIRGPVSASSVGGGFVGLVDADVEGEVEGPGEDGDLGAGGGGAAEAVAAVLGAGPACRK
jgi:hypothetical protein